MFERKRHVSHALVAAAAVLLVASRASADSPVGGEDPKRTDEARIRFQRGVELYKDGDYRASIIEFRRAYELVPSWRIQYNLAQACAEVQDHPCTLRALEAYLAGGGAEVPEDRRTAVEAELRRVRGRVARVHVTVNREGADVLVDEATVGKSPLAEAALVGAGRRKVSAILPSGQTQTKLVDVAGGDDLTVALEFVDAPVVVAPVARDVPVARAEEPPSRTPVVIGLVATGVLAAGTATTGILGLSAKSDFDKELDRLPGSEDAIAKARSRTDTFATVTDVLGAATLVAAGVTVYLALTRHAPPKPSVGLTILPSPTGIAGRF